ncbi:MAG: hypothetical protein K8T91_03800 [Planctomycetes bacterium]|nr:hypothetical protein [Planctomycetota bacterium]
MSAIPLSHLATGGSWQQNFMTILPAITNHAKIRFRGLPADQREEAIQEAVAAACAGYQKRAASGRLHVAYLSTLADHAARHVNQGRHVGGRQDTSKDVLSPTAQRRHGVHVASYHDQHPAGRGVSWRDTLIAKRRDSIPDAAAMRVDFAVWLKTLCHRDRRIIFALIAGERPSTLADRFGVSNARISQLRRRYEREWHVFQGECGMAA